MTGKRAVHTHRQMHTQTRTQTRWTLSRCGQMQPLWSVKYKTCIKLCLAATPQFRQGHMAVYKDWSGMDIEPMLRVQRSWLTPCFCSGGVSAGHPINPQSPVISDCVMLPGVLNRNIKLYLNNLVNVAFLKSLNALISSRFSGSIIKNSQISWQIKQKCSCINNIVRCLTVYRQYFNTHKNMYPIVLGEQSMFYYIALFLWIPDTSVEKMWVCFFHRDCAFWDCEE